MLMFRCHSKFNTVIYFPAACNVYNYITPGYYSGLVTEFIWDAELNNLVKEAKNHCTQAVEKNERPVQCDFCVKRPLYVYKCDCIS